MTDRFLKALQCQSVDSRPIWMMRQAGRYLPEYRELRAKVPDFMTFCKTPELACEVTLQPLRRFDLDASIIFSDILTIPEAMGLDLQFVQNEGPVFSNPISSARDLQALIMPEVEASLGYVADAIKLVVKELDGKLPLIGFAGSPWTLATYMIEGHGSKTFFKPRAMLYQDPQLLHSLLQKLTDVTIDYLCMQIDAGVSTLMLFDTWGGLLTTSAYQEFSLHYLHAIVEGVLTKRPESNVPFILYTKGGAGWLPMMLHSGVNALGLDWTVDLSKARQQVGMNVCLQGNLDPAVLLSTPEEVKRQVAALLKDIDGNIGHIFNLGHGIDRTTPIENVNALIEAVREFDL